MKPYKSLFEDIKYNFLIEMSRQRKLALIQISNQMSSLLFHLIAVSEQGVEDEDYQYHMSEIEAIKKKINRYNRSKNKPNKIWFSKSYIERLVREEDYIADAVDDFIKRYKKHPQKKYFDLEDFRWFKLLD